MRRRKVIIAGEIWSPNLGDGVIAESLRFLLQRAEPDICVQFLDISGRYASGRGSAHSSPTKGMSFVKAYIRKKSALSLLRNVVKWPIFTTQCVPRWSSQISGADALIIGGGQLLMDNALSFPLKINLVSRIGSSFEKDILFASCGVGQDWSFVASRLFRHALSPAVDITVRDNLSIQRLQELIPGITVSLCPDPAIWSADIYGRNERVAGSLIGLGLMDVDSVNRRNRNNLSREQLTDFWLRVAKRLYERGLEFEFFTNGSSYDYDFGRHLLGSMAAHSIPCSLVTRPTRPRELAQCISHYAAVIASRLHAHIIATSYRIPSVALVWDEKVRAFFQDTDRADLAFDVFDASAAEDVVESLCTTIDRPVSEHMLNEKRSLVSESIRRLLNAAY